MSRKQHKKRNPSISKISKNMKISIISGVIVGVLGLSLGLGLGLGLNTGFPDVINGFNFGQYRVEQKDAKTNYGAAAKKYFEDEANWNLSYIDDVKNVKLVNLPNEEEVLKQSNLMYQMLVYAFSDGDGDGIGDFWGARQRLPYLKKLGIGSIWLSPIHISPSYHAYDVMDYTSVSDDLGGEEAFDAFLREAHNLGIKIYLDTVFNHSSAKHPWFAKGVKGGNKYDTYYQFGGGQSAKNAGYNSDRKFYAAFNWHGMPDLRLANPEVRKEFEAVIEYWVKKGVDGFRYDAYKHFFDPGEEKIEGLTGVKIFSGLKAAAQRGAEAIGRTKPGETTDIQFMGEGLGVGFADILSYLNYEETTGTAPTTTTTYYPALDGAYDAGYWTNQWTALTTQKAATINDRTKRLQAEAIKGGSRRTSPWIPYLNNHDSSRWFERVRFELNSEGNFPTYTTSDDDRSLLRSGLLTLSMMPGRPIIYQGDELGYDAVKRSDPFVREPLTWSDEDPIKFYDYNIYDDGKLNTDADPIELTDSSEVGTADSRARVSNGIWEHASNYLKIRAENKWLEDGYYQLSTLNAITNNNDGGIRTRTDGSGNILEQIVFIGTNIYNDYNNKAKTSNTYDLNTFVNNRSVEVLYKSSTTSYNNVTNTAIVARNGVIVLKVK